MGNHAIAKSARGQDKKVKEDFCDLEGRCFSLDRVCQWTWKSFIARFISNVISLHTDIVTEV